jgi:hypothetical protein
MILNNPEEIVDFLNEVAKMKIPSVKNRINRGSFVTLTKYDGQRAYLIDNSQIFKDLPGFDKELPLEAIYNLFPGRIEEREELFGIEGTTVPAFEKYLHFSRAVEKGVGGCLERSILLQLTQQDERRSFYLSGRGEFLDGEGGHAFNLVEINGNWCVVDVKQMEPKEDGYRPFVVPITKMDLSDGEIHLEEKLSDGRRLWLGRMSEIREYMRISL